MRKTNRRHMTGDHHGRTARTATLLVTAVDEILGTHSYQHAPACWIEAVFDTSDGYHDDHGGAGTLHQRLVTGLGQWLDAQAVRWSWRNHGDGILHDRHDGLAGLTLLAK
jgi:hypothetical protein